MSAPAPTTAPAPVATGAVDVDVHVAPESMATLHPHFDAYWQEFLDDSGLVIKGLPRAYPPNAPSTATDAARAIAPNGMPTELAHLEEGLLGPASPSTVVLSCVTGFEAPRNHLYAAAAASALNSWQRSEWLDRDDRLRGSVVVAHNDPIAAAEEIDRVGGDPRMVQVLLPVRSEIPYGNRHWLPVMEAAVRNDLVVGLHAWGPPGMAPSPTGFAGSYMEDYLVNAQLVQLQLTSLVTEGSFVRMPDLRVALLECGFSWLSPFLWRFDKDWKGLWRETPWVKERPSHYIRTHVRASTQPAHLPDDPARIRAVVEAIGVGWLLHASDHPHDHGGGQAKLLAALTDEQRTAVLTTNAVDFYRLGQ